MCHVCDTLKGKDPTLNVKDCKHGTFANGEMLLNHMVNS